MSTPITPTRREVLRWLPCAMAAGAGPARAQGAATPAAPRGPVVLTLAGALRRPNRGDVAEFDMPMLERLPQHRVVTATPWFPGDVAFTGPLLSDILAAAGAHGATLRMSALNDYRVDVPADDAQRYGVVVARLRDDKPMPVRDKGPLFVIYPFSRHPQLRTSVYFSRCIWQLRRIEVA